MVPRPYDLGRRRIATEATRRQILDAAREIVGGQGDLDRFSMEAVAERAGVARMTVYYQFKSRGGLLESLADDLAERGGMRGLAAAFRADSPFEAVHLFVETFTGFWAKDRDTMRRVRAMGVAFPSQYGGPRSRDDWRREAASNLLAKVEPPSRHVDSSQRQARVDLLATFTSFETFDALCTGERSPQAVAELLTNILWAILNASPGGSSSRRGPSFRPRRSTERTVPSSPSGSTR